MTERRQHRSNNLQHDSYGQTKRKKRRERGENGKEEGEIMVAHGDEIHALAVSALEGGVEGGSACHVKLMTEGLK